MGNKVGAAAMWGQEWFGESRLSSLGKFGGGHHAVAGDSARMISLESCRRPTSQVASLSWKRRGRENKERLDSCPVGISRDISLEGGHVSMMRYPL